MSLFIPPRDPALFQTQDKMRSEKYSYSYSISSSQIQHTKREKIYYSMFRHNLTVYLMSEHCTGHITFVWPNFPESPCLNFYQKRPLLTTNTKRSVVRVQSTTPHILLSQTIRIWSSTYALVGNLTDVSCTVFISKVRLCCIQQMWR